MKGDGGRGGEEHSRNGWWQRRWPIKPFSPSLPRSNARFTRVPSSYGIVLPGKVSAICRLLVFVYVFVVRPSVTKLDANVSAKGKPSPKGASERGRGRENGASWLSSWYSVSTTGQFFVGVTPPKRRTDARQKFDREGGVLEVGVVGPFAMKKPSSPLKDDLPRR